MLKLNFQELYQFTTSDEERYLLGPQNKNIKLLEEELNVDIVVAYGTLKANGNPEVLEKLKKVITLMIELHHQNIPITERDVVNLLTMINEASVEEVISLYKSKEIVVNTVDGKSIFAKTLRQKEYIRAMKNESIVFSIGAAGTGKTYLAVMYGISQLKSGNVKKLILTRPAVEAGEKLGFLPGDLKEKVDPYLIPLYDALDEGFGKETVNKLIEKGTIEIAPLAYMRGRTLDNAFIILDEAQNTTPPQMKMFLTRLGFNSQMVITGDDTQIDLPNRNASGLIEAIRILTDIRGIKVIRFMRGDVMRHPIVAKIVSKYEESTND
jgi:phosphate starvation-inducible PhoH-like protein